MTTQKMNVDLNLRKLQERIEDTGKQSKILTRRAALTYLGLLGMAYDAGKNLVNESSRMLSEAEERGTRMERTLNRSWSSMESRLTGQVRSWREQVQQRTEELSHDLSEHLTERGKEIEENARKFVSRIKPEGRRTPGFSAPKFNEVNIEVEVAEKPPFEGYDAMTVQDVIGRLPGFTNETLAAIRAYEVAHKNRVTVLREIDTRMETPAEPVE